MRRTSLAREDNDVQRFDIRAARRIIYQGNFRVNNDATETILKKISRVPTLVSDPICCSCKFSYFLIFGRMLSQLAWPALISTYTQC